MFLRKLEKMCLYGIQLIYCFGIAIQLLLSYKLQVIFDNPGQCIFHECKRNYSIRQENI